MMVISVFSAEATLQDAVPRAHAALIHHSRRGRARFGDRPLQRQTSNPVCTATHTAHPNSTQLRR